MESIAYTFVPGIEVKEVKISSLTRHGRGMKAAGVRRGKIVVVSRIETRGEIVTYNFSYHAIVDGCL